MRQIHLRNEGDRDAGVIVEFMQPVRIAQTVLFKKRKLLNKRPFVRKRQIEGVCQRRSHGKYPRGGHFGRLSDRSVAYRSGPKTGHFYSCPRKRPFKPFLIEIKLFSKETRHEDGGIVLVFRS